MQLYVKTPLIDLNLDRGKTVCCKMEAYQPSGSFKLRGIENLMRCAISEGAEKFVSSSGGNAGLSAAYAGRKLAAKVTVVVPETTPSFIVKRLEGEGARAIVHGESWDESHTYALSLMERENAAYVPPFDHPKLWEGHATIVDELKEQCGVQPDLIVLSVGGGGLLCGVVEGLARNGWEDTPILAVETEGAASLYKSVEADTLITLDKIDSIATSLGAKRVAQQALAYAKEYNVIPYLVTDEAAMRSCARFADASRTLVEPACGASLSVLYDDPRITDTYRNIVVIVCGGAIVNLKKITEWRNMRSKTDR